MSSASSHSTESNARNEVPVLARGALVVPDAAATLAAGERLAGALSGGLFIALSGELGTGKTTLVRGALAALGWAGPVKSPTYTLVEGYPLSSLYFYHFDFYRLSSPDEWESLGFADHFHPATVCFAEWPERVGGHLPAPDLEITLAYRGDSPAAGRAIALVAHTPAGVRCLSAMMPPA